MIQETGDIAKACLIIHLPKDLSIATVQPKTAAALTEGVAGAAQWDPSLQMIEVQYNPSSLTLQANADSIQFTSLQTNECDSIPNQNSRMPTVMLGVELYFDAMNPRDAFMLDKARLSVGDAISGNSHLKRDTVYSVLPQTSAILALPMREDTKRVTFKWGKMSFTGIVAEVQAEYTMFSVSGQPIRSRVYMNIAQEIATEGDQKYWNEVIGKVFSQQDKVRKRKDHLLNVELF